MVYASFFDQFSQMRQEWTFVCLFAADKKKARAEGVGKNVTLEDWWFKETHIFFFPQNVQEFVEMIM
jgi:hypothetical protein